MTISLYAATVPALLQILTSLTITLKKTGEFAQSKGNEAETILGDRLIEDMLPMTRQVQITCDHAKGAMARISGKENPKFEDTETTVAELQSRIAKTVEFVKSFKASDLDGQEERAVTIKLPNSEMTMPAQTYLTNYALPNIYFHASMAYAVARKNGVPLGKANFMGRE
ncbi:MAG: DUF1993 domain-containing protein [Rhizobiaceae bacterium]